MATVILVQATPRYASGAPVDIRLAGGGSKAFTQLGFNDWRNGIANPPRFTTALDFEQDGFTGGALPQTAGLRFFPSDKTLLAALGNLVWAGARITISSGDDEAGSAVYPAIFVGTVASIKTAGGALTLTLADLSLDLKKPVCPDTFAGTGDLEGGDDATGRVKRRTWGYAFNVEGRVLDKANNVYEFGDPNRQLYAFPAVKDKGRAGPTTTVGWQGSALATLNALRAATPPSGGAVVAPSIACVKWWTTPSGPLTADINGEVGAGYVEAAQQIAARIVGVYSTSIAIGNLSASLAQVSASCGVHCGDGAETVDNLLDRLLLPCSIAYILDGSGTLSFQRMTWSGPVDALLADTIAREDVFKPLRTRRVGFQRNYRQHSDAEISAALLLATDATYADGTPIEVLKPAEAGANITENRTAAAITGQGAFATKSSAAYGSALLTGFGYLSPLNSVSFGSPYVLETTNGIQATLAAFKTILGTAGAITGQGAFATTNVAAYGSTLLSGFGLLSPLDALSFGSNYMLEQPNGASASLANFKTILGIASGFSGQGSLATKSTISSSSDLSGAVYNRLQGSPADINFLAASRMAWDGGDTVQNFKPATYGSDKTSNATAAAITGQGAFATTNVAAYGSTLLSGFGLLSPLNAVSFGSNYLLEQSGGASAALNAFKTALGVASGISGQGSLATKSTISSSSDLSGAVYNRLQSSPADINFLAASRMAWDGGDTVQNFKPATYGSDKTSNATAAAITGQGAFATKSSAAYGSPLLTGFGALAPASAVSFNTGTITTAGGATATDANYYTSLGTASAIAGQGALATAPQINSGNVASYFNYSAFQLGYSITRSDGSSIVTESLVVTSVGVSAGISGQGRGATANSLADLDPSAAAKLSAATGAVAKNGSSHMATSGGDLTGDYALVSLANVSSGSFVELSGEVQLTDVSPSGASWTGTVGIYDGGNLVATVGLSGTPGTEQDYDTRYQTNASGTLSLTTRAQRTSGAGNATIDVSAFAKATPSG